MRNKIYSSGRVRVVDADNFVTEHVISTEDVDRDGEVVVFDDLERAARNFVNNPVVLFFHNADPATPKLPIGRNLELRREQGRVVARTQFAVREDQSGFTRTLWNLHVGGYLNGVSIGFRPERVEVVGQGREAVRVVHVDELLEYSLVPIPANPEALTSMAKALADRRRVQLGKPSAYVTGFATADAALNALSGERDPGQPDAQRRAVRPRRRVGDQRARPAAGAAVHVAGRACGLQKQRHAVHQPRVAHSPGRRRDHRRESGLSAQHPTDLLVHHHACRLVFLRVGGGMLGRFDQPQRIQRLRAATQARGRIRGQVVRTL
ncbi:MAG: HK97 family phage prohead protease [Candidatus Alcyoniella australis]|nr:HK97 family phage prohead protease [Candidatus Alcyoniella australis]